MARKKKVEEEQPVTAEVVETKKKSSKKAPKTKMSAQKESIQETGVQEPIVKEENTKDSFKEKDYTIDELIDMLGPDIDCEDDTEFSLTENTSSQEQEYTIEDMLSGSPSCSLCRRSQRPGWPCQRISGSTRQMV